MPIRVFVSHHDVRHPGLMLVSRREMVIGLDVGRDRLAERHASIDPVPLTRIEPIHGKRRRGDGQRTKR